MRPSSWLLLVAGSLVVGLPFLGHLYRQQHGPRCALDGVAIEPAYRARVVDQDGRSYEFCCVRCAETWLRHRGAKPAAIYVTDEVTGGEIAVEDAVFVRSAVVTAAVTGNRVHVFHDPAQAERHAAECRGIILEGSERPFAGL